MKIFCKGGCIGLTSLREWISSLVRLHVIRDLSFFRDLRDRIRDIRDAGLRKKLQTHLFIMLTVF